VMKEKEAPSDTPELRLAARRARVAEALRTGDTASLRSSRDLSSYAWELSRAGRLEEAVAIALIIEGDPEERGEILALLAKNLARSGSVDRALALIDQIPDDSTIPDALQEKIYALVAAAAAIAAAGRLADADGLIERALTSREVLGDDGNPWLEPEISLEWGRIHKSSDREKALGLWRRAAHRAEQLSSDINCLKLLGEIGAEFARAGAVLDAEAIMNNHPSSIISERLRAEIDQYRSDGGHF
jgi:tetratricopeptide (TPR) repeat protein